MNRVKNFLLLLFFLLSITANSQDVYYKEHGTNYSPYHTIYTHYHFLTGKDYNPNISAKAFKGESQSNRTKLAVKLKQVLDGKGLRINLDDVPKDPKYLDSITHTSIYKPFQKQDDIYLEKSEGKWYYSQATMDAIPKLHKEIYPLGSDIWVNIVPDKLHTNIFWLNTWQWFGILMIILLAICVYRMLAIPANLFIMQLARKHVEWDESNIKLSKKTARTTSLLLSILVVSKLIPTIQFSSKTSQFLVFGLNVMAITFSVILFWRLVDIIMLYIGRKRGVQGLLMEEQHLSVIRKTIKIFLVITGPILILSMMGTNITALLAGLSVGGLAVALAAQDTIKNMFGALMILVDKPFKSGDWIKSEGIDGIVENIGLRSTRIRTLEDSLVYVPNGKLADLTIDNLGARSYRRFRMNISITYNTPPFVVQKFCDGIREIILRHPLSNKDRVDCRLNEMGESGLIIFVSSFYRLDTNSEEWLVHNEILMAILLLADCLGVRFAYPTTTLHVETLNNNAEANFIRPSPQAVEEQFRKYFNDFKPSWKSQEQVEQ